MESYIHYATTGFVRVDSASPVETSNSEVLYNLKTGSARQLLEVGIDSPDNLADRIESLHGRSQTP